MQDSFKALIGTVKSVLIVLPRTAKFDEVASGLTLELALSQEEGKEISIYSPTPMVVEFNRLIGVNKIKNEIGNKNLAINFAGYNPQGIDKVSYDIDGNGEFKLIFTTQAKALPPTAEQVKVSYFGVQADLVILIGGKNAEDFEVVKSEDLANAKIAHIGIESIAIEGKNISSFATTGSSISEVIANMVKVANYKIDGDIATDLVMGIEEATKGFATNNVTSDTFLLIGELMKLGGKRLSQGQVTAKDFPMGAIPGMQQAPSSWMEQPKIFKGTSNS